MTKETAAQHNPVVFSRLGPMPPHNDVRPFAALQRQRGYAAYLIPIGDPSVILPP